MKETALADLMEAYDAFLLDQFGVLIDGTVAYPGAPEALAELVRRGKKVGILTNSGKRAAPNAARLKRLGFQAVPEDAVFSSGEAARKVIAAMIGPVLAPEAPVLVLSRDGDTSCLDGLELRLTDDPTEARFVLIAGSRGEEVTLEEYRALLRDPAARKVQAFCTNPDRKMLTPGGLAFGAGRIAELYAELGGPVEEIGKPHPLIYRVALAEMGIDRPETVLCIGDSPAHDMRGAHGAGCHGALTRTGIHAGDPLEQVLAAAPPADHPDFVIPRFAL